MRKRILIAAVALALLCGCAMPWGQGDRARETVYVYRLAASGERGASGGELLDQELCELPEEADSELEGAIQLLASPSKTDGLVCAFPADVRVLGWRQDGGNLTVILSDGFLALDGIDRTAAAFCAALTLCQLDGVETVSVSSGGQSIFSNLSPADALLRDTDTDPYVRQLRLYFADGAGRYLVSEYHSLTLEEDASPERYVVEELLRGPNSTELQSAVPAGTELLSCRTEDGVCTVDLSAAFYENRPRTAVGERLALCAIVNSLTALNQVDSVVLLVEGQSLDRYVYRPLDRPLVRYDGAVGPVAADKGELDTDLYLALPGLEAIAPLPWRVAPGEYDSAAEAVLAALLAIEEPGYPLLFPGSGTVGQVAQWGSVCTIDLTESFFASLPEAHRNAAIQSVAASVCALEEVEQVFFTIGGQPAIFEGVEWFGPWNQFDLIKQ